MIYGMYTVWDAQGHMSPVGVGAGEENLCHVPGEMLSYTCLQWGMGEERRISAMFTVGDAQ